MGLTPMGVGGPYGAPFQSTYPELPSPTASAMGAGDPMT
jgi:hypothetical protein